MTVLILVSSCNPTHHNTTITERSSVIFDSHDALVRMDTTKPTVYLIFSGHDHNEGRMKVLSTLSEKNAKASFFFTGDFYRNEENKEFIKSLVRNNHYLGGHSNSHLLYADWSHRDSTLVSRDSFMTDLKANYQTMKDQSIDRKAASVFLPPYEWYNRDIVDWTEDLGLTLINLTPGIGTARDYTWPEMGNRYTSSKIIFDDLISYEMQHSLNGAIILVHLGTDPRRTDKFYDHLPQLIDTLRARGYAFNAFDN